jgi:excisionase family DNA binding protein
MKAAKTFAFTPEVFTIEEAAFYLGVSKRTLEEYIHQGMIEIFKLPRPGKTNERLGRTHIRRAALDRFIEEFGRRG